jgi:3-deoxy-D-manno-octulosonate 8-phosphate phosphatase (KDO 8-P phosphatase)
MPKPEAAPEAIRARLAAIELLTFDLDGTLTDATTWWAGEAAGWVQRYSVRDGEALLRMSRAGFPVVPLSRNKTDAARRRVEHMRCSTNWIGVDDKLAALAQICEQHGVAADRVLHVGDGLDDAPVFERVGLGVAVADAHPIAIRTAGLLLSASGGTRVIEELEGLLMAAGHPVLTGNGVLR